MNILVTGAAGLIGTALWYRTLSRNKHRVLRLVRKAQAAPGEIRWDPSAQTMDTEALERLDAVVHLAGENLEKGDGTPEKKIESGKAAFRAPVSFSQCLARLFDPPKVLVSVSAIGYYGDRGEDPLDEESGPGKGLLADVCREWEAATEPAVMRGIRVVHPRIGMVLTTKGGALARMLPAFRLGIGGRIGSGRQFMSWVAVEDLAGIIDYVIHNGSLHGPVNAVSPNPVTNLDFSNHAGARTFKTGAPGSACLRRPHRFRRNGGCTAPGQHPRFAGKAERIGIQISVPRTGRRSPPCIGTAGNLRIAPMASQKTSANGIPDARLCFDPRALGLEEFPRQFFLLGTAHVARAIIGAWFARRHDNQWYGARIVETEAYLGSTDAAAHSFGGRRTPRVEPMYMEGGHLYVFFVYGMHCCANIVTQPRGTAEAVLLRAAESPAVSPAKLLSGPGKLCAALGIGVTHSGLDLLDGGDLRLFQPDRKGARIGISRRIGVDYAGEAAGWPLRFFDVDSDAVSGPAKLRTLP